MKEIIFYSYGDSADVSTWSNVPYLFTRALERKGYVIRRVNLFPHQIFSIIYNWAILPVSRILKHRYSGCPYIRSLFFKFLAEIKIRRSVKRYPFAELCVFSCFDFYNKFSEIPTLLYGDWTLDIQIFDREMRAPRKFEVRYIDQQRKAISQAKYVVSMFPTCADTIKERNPLGNVFYLGKGVVNSTYYSDITKEDLLGVKTQSRIILFIGRTHYAEACKKTILAINYLKNEGYELHIIGMIRDDIEGIEVGPNIHFHGFLRKNVEKEWRLYYDLMKKAHIFINPSPTWGGYSSTVEAMYFYTPVIISPYQDFVREFGVENNFGVYNIDYTTEGIVHDITAISTAANYKEMCNNAHQKVCDNSWDNYVEILLSKLE